jgi:hypothetical protein
MERTNRFAAIAQDRQFGRACAPPAPETLNPADGSRQPALESGRSAGWGDTLGRQRDCGQHGHAILGVPFVLNLRRERLAVAAPGIRGRQVRLRAIQYRAATGPATGIQAAARRCVSAS